MEVPISEHNTDEEDEDEENFYESIEDFIRDETKDRKFNNIGPFVEKLESIIITYANQRAQKAQILARFLRFILRLKKHYITSLMDTDTIVIDELKKFLKKKITVSHARGILVGCADAGKTTLLKRLKGQFQIGNEITEPTRGLEVHQHLFLVRNGVLEVTNDDSTLKTFIRINSEDLKLDPSTSADNSNINDKKDSQELKNADKGTEVIYSREEENLKTRGTPVEDTEEDNTVEIMASILSSKTMIMGDFFQKILADKETLPTVSIVDFAGQFAYYACHQIYITPKAFFILVLDMTKKFSDPVSKDKDNQEGSIFSMWTYRDYLKFWITSIKTFGGKKAPVFVIVTHAENKSTNEIEKFFTELWDTVPAEETDWLSDSLNDREYAVGLLELNDNSKQMLNSIKESIVELFKNEINTKMELPSSWALMEQLLYDGDWKVLSLADIWRLNSSLPHEYKIKSNGEMSDFLKCFNDNGLILYCEEKNLREHAILDIQWFANAFSKIIADENHITKDCRRSLRREWKSFNKTGELKEKVVDALWKDEPSYLKHKSEIMSYMEKLQMLVPLESFGALSEGGMTWYVPCMNKKQFKADFCEEKWDRSSILCFRFTSFAIFEFYRLVAYCIGVLSWKVSTDGDNEGNLCLYQTAAVFDCKEHTVAIGICNDEIQLQVLRIKPLTVEKEVSSKIGHSIENAVEILTKTFTDTKKFQKGIKCQKNIFYENDTSFTLVSELSKIKTEKTQCACRLQEKHIITLQKTLGFWEKKREGSPRKSCTYPFSKRASQKDALTSHLKAEVIRSVGLIYVDGHPAGTGFRVGEKYIMTCLHIIERIVQGPLDFIRCERVYIQFERMVHLQNTDQSKIFLIEPTLVYKHQEFDVAVLELKKQGIQFPQPLTLFSANCLPSEEVHLIGHPGGVQMKEDSEVYLSVIEPNNDVDKYIKELSEWSMEKFMNNVDYYSRLRELPRKILFHTTFDQGSSGSPGILIRNHKPCVALIVAGGVPSFYYEDGVYVEPEKRVEFGYALRDVFDEMQTNEINKKLSSEIFKEWIS